MDAPSYGALQPIVQVHPTRRCNLRCLHCYSRSGPEERDTLAFDTLAECLRDAEAQGYRVASFSGGEPVLFQDLGRLLRLAKDLGMRTTVTSNGMLLNERRLTMLAGYTDVLAISLDGVPQSHNRIRGSNEAFERMQANLEDVRRSGIDFGFIFTLTQYNVNELDWVARFAVEQGAKLLQIHPMEEVGRAADLLAGSRPDEIESAYAFLEAERIRQQYKGRPFVQFDIFHRELVAQFPERFYAGDACPEATLLAKCVSPLVVEAEGVVVPLGYGFARPYALGTLLREPLRELAPAWIASRYKDFCALCRIVYAEACRPARLPFLNWYELIQLRSETAGVPAGPTAALQ